jgi:hypothetical protein
MYDGEEKGEDEPRSYHSSASVDALKSVFGMK